MKVKNDIPFLEDKHQKEKVNNTLYVAPVAIS